jgi:FKBP-type peptidyl-prolyl cis-trans isomerase
MDPGTGEKPQRGQKVKTTYKLFLNGFDQDSGELIDSSKGLFGESPFEFVVGVGQVVRGWDLALMDMKEREARRLVIPPDLGYGAKGAGGRIPGGATLFFEVQLTELGKKPDFNEDQLKWLEEHPL